MIDEKKAFRYGLSDELHEANESKEETPSAAPETPDTTPDPPAVHQGIIPVSAHYGLIPENGFSLTDVQGALLDAGIYDAVHRSLLLPESYVIRGIFYEWHTRRWNIFVEGESIPATEEGEQLPRLEPFYRREDGSTRLLEIKVTQRITTSHLLSKEELLKAYL
jgi:hypothetical protein